MISKSVLGLATLLYVALAATAAVAQTRPGFEAGLELTDYGYDERHEGEPVASDDGRFAGFTLGYTHTFGRTFVRGRLNLNFGSVDYQSDNGETRLNDVSQSIGQLQFHAGRDFALSGGATVSPFVGIGSRSLSDQSGGLESENGFAGYDRKVNYAYVPIGADAGFALGRSRLTVSAQYNWLVGGDVESELSGVDPEIPDITVELNGGSGYELSAMLAVPMGRSVISIGPFVRRWSIDQSESVILTDPSGSGETLELFEPGNRTIEMGLRLSFSF